MKIGPLELGGNVWCLAWLYVSWAKTDGGGWPIQRTWVNEPEAPWRYGRGLGLRLPFHRMVTAGLWWRQDVAALAEHASEDVAASLDIEQWASWDEEVSRAYAEACDDDGRGLVHQEGAEAAPVADEGCHGTAPSAVVQGGDARSAAVGRAVDVRDRPVSASAHG